MKNEKGTAMVELAVVVPFFVILMLGLVDVAFTIQKSQYLSVVVRELGNTSFRKCKDASVGAATDTCLKVAAEEVLEFTKTSSVISDTDVLIQSWKVNGSKGFSTAPTLKGTYKVGNTLVSQYKSTVVLNLNSYDYNLRDTLITVEVLNKNSTNPFLSFSRNLYENIIF